MIPELLKKSETHSVWNKPAGMTVHNESPSLLEFLKKQNPRGEFHFLNRLDRETSGAVVVCPTADSVARLQKIWLANETRKIYVGIHRKRKDFVFAPAVWDQPLTDRSEGRKNPEGIKKDRVPSSTKLFPLLESEHLFLSSLILETGRQHQIRKHAALNGAELLGDTRYGDPKYLERVKEHLPEMRLALHAAFLLWNPGHSERVEAPLPAFFTTLFPDATSKVRSFIDSL